MKQMSEIKNKRWICLFVWPVLLLGGGCTRTEVEDDIPLHALKEVDAGFLLNVQANRIPVTRSITFTADGTMDSDSLTAGDHKQIGTRAANPLEEALESKVATIWVGQYAASDGTLLYHKYISSLTGNTLNVKLKQSKNNADSHVWFVANAGDLGEIATETNLKEHLLSYTSTSLGLPENNLCGMTGQWTGVVKEGGIKDIEVKLTRLVAKISFTYSMGGTGFTFTPTHVTLNSVPQKIQIDVLKGQPADMAYTNYTGIVDEEGATMYWYLPENMAGTGGGSDVVTSEKKKTGKGVSNATYVELTGTAVQSGVTYKNVVFRFYPGSGVNNYDVERNSHYVMNVKLAGIDISDERIVINEIPPIVVDPVKMPAEKGGTKEVQITARPGQGWSFDIEEWLSAVIDGKTAGTGTQVNYQGPALVTFQAVSANPKAEDRSVGFSVNVNGEEQAVTITQSGSTLTTGRAISLNAAFGSEGTSTFSVTKGLQWLAALSGEDWWNWADDNPGASGNESTGEEQTLKVAVTSSNPLAAERSGKITVSAGASVGDPAYTGLRKEIAVKQAGSTVQGSEVSVTPEASEGLTSSFIATPGLAWAVKGTSDDWITVTGETSGNQTTGTAQSIQFNVEVNPSSTARNGNITVRAGDETNGPTGKITVNQNASVFSVISPNVQIGNAGGSVTGLVTTTVGLPWTVSPESDNGITVSPVRGTGDASLTFTASVNKGSERTGLFIVKVTGASPERTAKVTATQVAVNWVTIDDAIVKSYKAATTDYETYPPFNYDGGGLTGRGSDRNGVSSSCTLNEAYSIEVEMTDRGTNSNYAAAVSYCRDKGSNWRVPTIIELKAIYDNKAALIDKGLTEFNKSGYWSSSVYVYNGKYDARCVLGFVTGTIAWSGMSDKGSIRCVRNEE